MISLLIIDDHPLVSDGVAAMLKGVEYIQIVGACKTAAEALQFLKSADPDIILLDISLPDIDGLELCTLIRKKNKRSKIIGLTSTNEAGIITQLLSKGANGYLLKNMERDELILAINEVLNNKIFLSKAANQKILEQYNNVADALNSVPVLTRREKEILQLLYEGFTGPQIAEQLFLSPYTIETHRKNLLQKLNVSSTQLMIRYATENKLL